MNFENQKIYVHFHSGIEHEDRILTVERLVEDLKQVLGNKTALIRENGEIFARGSSLICISCLSCFDDYVLNTRLGS